MAFELFKDYGAASRNTVTLRASGYLFIPDMLKKKSSCANATHVKLYIDRESMKIGIEFTEGPENSNEGVKKLTTENSGVAVNTLPILRFLDIEKQDNKKILNTSRDNELLVVDIKELKEESPQSNDPE